MAATGTRYYTPNPFEFDNNGVPLAGASLFFFQTGTNTPQATFADVALTTPNANPVIADGNGRFGTIFLSPSSAYKVQLVNSVGTQIWTEDPVGPGAGGGATATAGIIGEVRFFAGPASAIPSQWYLCFGQLVSRTTFASLFAVIGTTWGAGDGSTTFALPDLRGKAMFGVDNMGGTPANIVTAGVSGIAGATLGAVGGNQAVQTHTHTLNDPTHTHTVTDPQHDHLIRTFFGAGGSLSVAGGPPPTWSNDTNAFLDFFSDPASTGISIVAAATGITIANFGAGSSQNMPPAAMCNAIIFAAA